VRQEAPTSVSRSETRQRGTTVRFSRPAPGFCRPRSWSDSPSCASPGHAFCISSRMGGLTYSMRSIRGVARKSVPAPRAASLRTRRCGRVGALRCSHRCLCDRKDASDGAPWPLSYAGECRTGPRGRGGNAPDRGGLPGAVPTKGMAGTGGSSRKDCSWKDRNLPDRHDGLMSNPQGGSRAAVRKAPTRRRPRLKA
jgi:hypothetical protein